MKQDFELVDKFGRKHNYLRISLTERCNLRCTYCMPPEGVELGPKSQYMTADEILKIASEFVSMGVDKIRLTGGEPLIRKDFEHILRSLASLNVELAITSNAVILDKYLDLFKELGVKNLNLSLDSLNKEKFSTITRRNYFEKVMNNIQLFLDEGFRLKINTVLIKGFNEDEIVPFIKWTKDKDLHVRFIEFMPFDGNSWNMDKMVSLKEINEIANKYFTEEEVLRIEDKPNDTAKNYRVKGYKGTFAVISSVTNPFCDSCNRIRLTSDGKLKNCLFSSGESDLLIRLREGGSIKDLILENLSAKMKVRSGKNTLEDFKNEDWHKTNRSMVRIGG